MAHVQKKDALLSATQFCQPDKFRNDFLSRADKKGVQRFAKPSKGPSRKLS